MRKLVSWALFSGMASGTSPSCVNTAVNARIIACITPLVWLRLNKTTFNYEQMGMETERLKRVIDERAVGSYVRNKRYVDDDSFKAITKVKEGVSKVRSLEEFLR